MSLIELLQPHARSGGAPHKQYGVVVGLVKDIKDPLGQGRVKVDFPWLAEEADAVANQQEDRAHSYWARIATLMAGPERGSFFIPEVGDEVLVAFEHGDLDRPFVLGALWNSDAAAPVEMDADGNNHIRQITTRSGHVLSFDDNDEEQKSKISIQSSGGHQCVLDDDGGQGKVELTTAAGHQVLLDDAGGTVTIADKSGSNKLVLDANANSVTIESTANTDHTVGANLTVNVTGTATIKAPAGVTIDSTSIKLGASAALGLVNDTLLDIFNAHFHVGNLGAPTSPPTIPAIKNVQSTIFTKGA